MQEQQRWENIVHNLVDRANLTPPCPNGCKAAISDAVSIGLFPGSDSNVFSSFSLPPFPTIRKYSSILSSSQSPNHQRTPPKTHTPHTQVLDQVPQFSRKVGLGTFQVPSNPAQWNAGDGLSSWREGKQLGPPKECKGPAAPTFLPAGNFFQRPKAFPFKTNCFIGVHSGCGYINSSRQPIGGG